MLNKYITACKDLYYYQKAFPKVSFETAILL